VPKRVYLLGIGIALVAGALALTHELLSPWPGVTAANVERIRKGMPRAEVEALLGGPGNDWQPWGNGSIVWTDGHCSVQVWFKGQPPRASGIWVIGTPRRLR
jgi:hypothetical protein